MIFFEKQKLHFREFLSSFSKGEISKDNVEHITNALQNYVNVNMSVSIDNVNEFSEVCNLKNCTTYKIINHNFVVQKIESSHLLISSEGVEIAISTSSHDLSKEREDTFVTLGTVSFPTDKTCFVFFRQESFIAMKKETEIKYYLSIFLPEKK